MTKTAPMTAADRDALIAQAIAAGLTAERTAKDFFVGTGEDRVRITPGQLKALITEEQERREAFAAAEELRAEVASDAPEETPVAVEPALEAAQPEAQIEAQTEAEPAPQAQPSKAVIRFGPPCGGDIAHLNLATSAEARNPLLHLDVPVQSKHKTKADAAAAGKQHGGRGFLAFLAQDAQGEQFWVVATVDADGRLQLDGTEVTLNLLEGDAAEAARAKLKGERVKAKSQWLAQAV